VTRTTKTLRRLLAAATNSRRFGGLGALARSRSLFSQPVERYEPGRAKVIVLAPHMDDEVLGCGGTMARHASAGSVVHVIFLTDGRRGGGGMKSPDGAAMRTQEVVAIRKAEAQRAAQVLGVGTLTFLDAEDSRLSSDTQIGMRLREILVGEEPDIVYLPFFMEAHPDHRAANTVLSAATRGTSLRFECRGYEVWTPLFANSVVRIDETIDAKRQAMECYRSQLAETDYLHCINGLNAYRAMAFGTGTARFAEAFHALTLSDYLHLHQQLLAHQ
jgi:N-acetylglucosamine malate deacetylase 1